MEKDLKLLSRKTIELKAVASICALIALLLLFTQCTLNQEEESETIPMPSLPLAVFEGEFLYGNIPKPTEADIYVFMNSEDERYYHYSYQFDNFTIEEAKDYVALLEETVIQERVAYDIYEKNNFKTLNYFAWLEDGNAISLSQLDSSGGIVINVKKNN